ncbi:MAG: TrkH family potassium uptake protein [Christensenellaceae bacterium]|jgi:trk system potassium uptake protein TrkH|nr:TrkH family potassium uptake protein [Christensenellaceae bacterium]
MNLRMMLSILANILGLAALFMLPPLGIALYGAETEAARAFALTICLMLLPQLLRFLFPPKNSRFYLREGFILAALSWLTVSFFGCLPLYFSGAVPGFLNCFFEISSSLTTTGASIVADVGALPRSILFWRNLSQWLGGMGMLAFMLAIVPMGRDAGTAYSMHILQAETTGPQGDKIVPKSKSAALHIYGIYVLMTLTVFCLLLLGGMEPFGALSLAFGTAGTGGLAATQDSLLAQSSYTQIVVTVFMLLFSVSFSIYYYLFIRHSFRRAALNQELKLYLSLLAISCLFVFLNVYPLYENPLTALKHAAFQVVSFASGTTFASANTALWPSFSLTLLLFLRCVGGCAGSTSGGLKVIRVLILFKHVKNSMLKILRPNTVRLMHIDENIVDEKAIEQTLLFVVLYVMIAAISMLLISLDGFSTEHSQRVVLSALNNASPGAENIGAAADYSGFSALSKLILCADMFLGRLEIFPLVMLFWPAMWKR